MKSENATKILTGYYGRFGFLYLVFYIVQFLLLIFGVNAYSDVSDDMSCGGLSSADSQALFDKAILLLTIYHLIEWLRWAVLLTVCFIGHNLVPIWYITTPNTLFGIVAHIIGIMALMTDNQDCKDAQQSRFGYLKWNAISIIFFVLTMFPFMYMKFFSEQSLQSALKDDDDDDDDEDDKDE